MSRTARDKRPNVKPVKRLTLEEGNTKRRLLVVIILVIMAAAFFAYGIHGLVNRRSGWTTVEPVFSQNLGCSDEFVLQYMLGESGRSGTAEYKQLSVLFKQNLEDCAKLFDADSLYEGVVNLAYINARPNEELEVDARLFKALRIFDEQGSRALFYAPIYRYYAMLFACNTDEEASGFDPGRDAETAAIFEQALGFIKDEEAVRLEFLGKNKIKLCVSKAYLDFAEQNELPYFVDFAWMKNAFIVDEIADAMLGENLTYGMISSYDGFGRNLYEGEQSFSLNVFDYGKEIIDFEIKGLVIPAARLDYTGALSIVTYRSFFMSSPDERHLYTYADGESIGAYFQPETGLPAAACPQLLAYARGESCAEVLLQTVQIYAEDRIDNEALRDLSAAGIQTVYCHDEKIFYTEEGAALRDLYKDEETEYRSQVLK